MTKKVKTFQCSEASIRDWLLENGLEVIDPRNDRRKKMKFHAKEIPLPSFENDFIFTLFGRELKPKERGKWGGSRYDTMVGRIDLVVKRGDNLFIVEVKKGKGLSQHIGQLFRYMNYFKFLKELLSEKDMERFLPGLKFDSDTNLKGILLARDFDWKVWWEIPEYHREDIKLYSYDIVFDKNGEIKSIKAQDESSQYKLEYDEHRSFLRKHGLELNSNKKTEK